MQNSKKLKFGGYILLESVLAMIALSMISMGFFTIYSGQFSTVNSLKDAMQAQQYAEIDAQRLRLMNYYDLEDDGAKSRSAMTSWDNPGNIWEDEITVGNEITVDDYNQSKQRIATIKIYRNGDTLPRYTVEVPISSQGSGIPIGTIVAWGVATNPSFDGGTYLECNGDTFDTSKYKRLYQVLGTNKLPDYRGLFLRGYGSQNYSQVNGNFFDSNDIHTLTYGAETTTTHSSASEVGKIQGDATRKFGAGGAPGYFPYSFVETYYSTFLFNENSVNDWYVKRKLSGEYIPVGINIYKGKSNLTNDYIFTSRPKRYTYKPIFDTFSTEEGSITYVSDIEEIVEELQDGEEGQQIQLLHAETYSETGDVNPVSNEIRPVNVAVKFMIKAK